MAIEVYLIRHGQTVGNLTGERHYNPALTDVGRLQSQRLAAALGGAGLTHCVCSPLLRALETAVPLARAAGVRLGVWNVLSEYNGWDPYTGATRAELAERFPEAVLEPEMPDTGWSYAGPEPVHEAEARARVVIARVTAAPDGSRMALVAHGTFNAMLIAAWLGVRRRGVAIAQDNACVNRLMVEPQRVTLLALNDTSHLGPDAVPGSSAPILHSQ